jgi:hypothetical protein
MTVRRGGSPSLQQRQPPRDLHNRLQSTETDASGPARPSRHGVGPRTAVATET